MDFRRYHNFPYCFTIIHWKRYHSVIQLVMPTVFCICEKCGEHFYSKDELYLSGIKMRFKIARNVQEPKTWDDWVHHLATNCEKCRLKAVPESCEADRLRSKY